MTPYTALQEFHETHFSARFSKNVGWGKPVCTFWAPNGTMVQATCQ